MLAALLLPKPALHVVMCLAQPTVSSTTADCVTPSLTPPQQASPSAQGIHERAATISSQPFVPPPPFTRRHFAKYIEEDLGADDLEDLYKEVRGGGRRREGGDTDNRRGGGLEGRHWRGGIGGACRQQSGQHLLQPAALSLLASPVSYFFTLREAGASAPPEQQRDGIEPFHQSHALRGHPSAPICSHSSPLTLTLSLFQVHEKIRANPVSEPKKRSKPAGAKRWQPAKSSYEERKERLKVRGRGGTGGQQWVVGPRKA